MQCFKDFLSIVGAYRYVCLGGSSSPTPSDGSHGYLCPAGHSCSVGSAQEVPCDLGTYSPSAGAALCVKCPKGTMCPSLATQEPSICPAGEDGENKQHTTVSRSHHFPFDMQQHTVKPIFSDCFLARSFLSCWDSPASAMPFGNSQQPDRSPLSLYLHILSLRSVL